MQKWLVIVLVLLTVILGACASRPERTLSEDLYDYMELPTGQNPLNLSEQRQIAHHGGIATFERRFGRPLQILQLSGGGQNGAFGAGILKGWSESGQRPQFDWVTGISTGALLATFAFLGTPEDDQTLQEIYTEITQSDIYKQRNPLTILGGENSLMDTTPMARLIEKHITMETLERVAREHEKGRRLAIGTSNLDYQQLWAWSLGEIATRRTPEALALYRKLLRAAASPPIVFPPVQVDGHLLADGAVIDNLLIAGLYEPAEENRFPDTVRGVIYTIHNGRLAVEPTPTEDSLLGLVSRTIEISLDQGMGSTLYNAYLAARLKGYDFYLLDIPQTAEMGANPLAFNQEEMRRLFELGRQLGRNPESWAHVPPPTQRVSPWLREEVDRLFKKSTS
jgi:predicted acylesterase/phospholipase RssA